MDRYRKMNKKKICVVTGSRADYGLLFWIMKAIERSETLALQTVATGMHLSPEFGLTYKEMERDGFIIDEKVETLLSSDTAVGIAKSTGLGVISFADAFNRLKPDLVLLLGDRFEILSATIAALMARIPVGPLPWRRTYGRGFRRIHPPFDHQNVSCPFCVHGKL